MVEVALETRNLSMRFGGICAVDNVDFKLNAGELRCLIGPNGAGKSTFFKCVTGQLDPSGGQVFMRDEEVTGWSPHEIASLGVGIKTQVPSVLDGLTAYENIWLAARRFLSVTEANRMTDEVISRLSLSDIINSDVGQLAHGERQRVELGIVMAADPWLILLDEPASGLSTEETQDVAFWIEDMKKVMGITVLMVEHDMHLVNSVSDRVLALADGKVITIGKPSEVQSHPEVIKAYIGSEEEGALA